ncbi:hypothetical protein [Halosimplex amylolyticum]|uniref:hypothetical protein n=1 Tax=Halosimplex amylolyticum TaxID=3396616 RepID=UPI003F55CC75
MTDPDTSADSDDAPAGARMMLEPDAVHEQEEGLAVDCPQCGATVGIQHIIEEGYCPGYVDDDEMNAESDETPREGGCGAKLSLELVWES